jgi:hypothetical protein
VVLKLRSAIFVLAFAACVTGVARADDPSPHEAKDEAQELVEHWTAAQNAGEFAAYRALYAPGFHGVRRSADRVARLDLEGWMRDRARMFRTPMKVVVSNERYAPGRKAVRVVFTQSWQSGSYRDFGRKELIVAPSEDGYRIVREELFTSTLGAPRPRALEPFLYVVDGQLVLSTEVEDAWEAGAPHAVPATGRATIRVHRPVRIAKLPKALAAWSGRTVRLFDARGARCEAVVGALELVGRASDAADGGSAKELWESTSHLLTAKLAPTTPCTGVLWARLASLPAPTMVIAEAATPELEKEAQAHFRAHAAYAGLQQDFVAYRARHKSLPARWDKAIGTPMQVVTMPLPSGERLVSVTASGGIADDEGCGGGFDAQLWLLWRVGADGVWRPANRVNAGLTLVPIALVDVDGDGAPELLFRGASNFSDTSGTGQPEELDMGIVRTVGDQYDDFEGLPLWSDVCPC